MAAQNPRDFDFFDVFSTKTMMMMMMVMPAGDDDNDDDGNQGTLQCISWFPGAQGPKKCRLGLRPPTHS